MDILSIIGSRRDGKRHAEAELRFLAEGAAKGTIPDYQLASWLMAAYLNPLSDEETAWLTLAMADSGERMDLTGLPKPWVDKHSTGGVGDKTTIILLPLLAACGLTLVKMSGRGLGITGGTIDKLESVPGFRVNLGPEEMKRQAAEVGLAITGQSPNLAPADKALYALRDVTGTVASIPLIVSSILSKKIAGGAETIVLDVKCGSGAFMRTTQEARALAVVLSQTAKRCGLSCRLAITDMNQPLGSAGNALEVAEALAILRGEPANEAQERLSTLCQELAGIALEASGLASTREEGVVRARAVLSEGAAYEKAGQWFAAQGGAVDARLPQAPVRREFVAKSDGWVSAIDAATVGNAVVALGGGRHKKDDQIDPSVGIETLVHVGSKVAKGQPICVVHAASDEAAGEALGRVGSAVSLAPFEVPVPEVVQTVL